VLLVAILVAGPRGSSTDGGTESADGDAVAPLADRAAANAARAPMGRRQNLDELTVPLVVDASALQVAGCQTLWRDGGCGGKIGEELPLTVWLPGASTATVLTADGTPLSHEAEQVQNGLQLRFSVASGQTGLRFAAVPPVAAAPRLILRWEAPVVELDVIRAMLRKGALDDAETRLDFVSLPESAVGRAPGLRARLVRRRVTAENGGTARDVEAAFRTSIAQHDRDGRLDRMASDSFALAYFLKERRRFEQGAAYLAAVPDLAALVPRKSQHLATLLRSTGHLASARTLLRQGSAQASRLGLQHVPLDMVLLDVVTQMERPDEARSVIQTLERDVADAKPCMKALNQLSVAWALLQVDGPQPIALKRLKSAVASFEAGGVCPDDAALASALVNLAHGNTRRATDFGAERTERLEAARRDRDRGCGLIQKPAWELRAECDELDGRITLLSGDAAGAARIFGRLEGHAKALGADEVQRRAAAGRKEAIAGQQGQ
jgi:hypothetical protein